MPTPLVAALGLLPLVLPVPALSKTFGFDDVAARAAALAAEDYHDPRGAVPDWLLQINYDQWRDIRFRRDQAVWAKSGLPFTIQFFHPGLFYDRTVIVNVVEADGVHTVPFSPSEFDYGKNDFESRVPHDLGFAGFRVHHPIKKKDYYDEVAVFLGGSYFRAVGRDQGFGLSARGIAVDTAAPQGEEFPYFREFWIVRPSRKAKSLEIHALLDGPRITGAYRFVLHPGVETLMDVEVRLFRRAAIQKLGYAPLTSMFLIGENSSGVEPPDYRPEVHDSDGLLMNTAAGEWLWRPLTHPPRLSVRSFGLPDPIGFGLMQRDRDFDHYQDLETRSELRPSAWVEPKGTWGKGRLELVLIPTPNETNDNIAAYWIPNEQPPIEQPIELAYRLVWYGDDPKRPPMGRVISTRSDAGTREGARRFLIDFEGKKLADIPADTVIEGVVSLAGEGGAETQLVEQQVVKNPVTKGWRLAFQIVPGGAAPVELRAFLRLGDETLTETWTYTLEP
jgi:glucans biosynthesis protein